jgi:hypothetical protein
MRNFRKNLLTVALSALAATDAGAAVFNVQKPARLSQGGDGIYRPARDNPAVKAGRKPPGAKVLPPDRPPTSEAPGVGADEFASAQTLAAPLTAEDVGPQWVKERRQAGESF